MAGLQQRRAQFIIIAALLYSLYILSVVVKPKRLLTRQLTLPDLDRQTIFQLPPHLQPLEDAGVDPAEVLALYDKNAVANQRSGQSRRAKTAQSKLVAKSRLFSRHPADAYTNFLWKCRTGEPRAVEVFETFVSLKHRIFEVRVASERYPMTYNPTIIALPPSSHYPFLIVARVRGGGFFQESLICEGKYIDEPFVNPWGFDVINRVIGCATNPRVLVVPQTPARDCTGIDFMSDVPGYHDPRIFWSNTGAPLMMFNQQSRYGCFGLWIIDLRSVYPSLRYRVTRGLLNQYPTVMELTRKEGRDPIEKNYLMFFDAETGAGYVQYEIGHGYRHFARLVGNGLTTSNMTSPFEVSCITEDATWHQATNAIKVVLCDYGECEPEPENTVYLAFLHKKEIPEEWKVQYKRYVAVWKSTAPFEMVGFGSKHVRFDNEDEWEQKFNVEGKFLYTVSIAWETNMNRYEGYLNENVIISLGVGDHGNAAVVMPVGDLMTCLRSCSHY
ncbi:hypothetical protein V1509DRAFT_626736 [Lipomyces kononenkoae]